MRRRGGWFSYERAAQLRRRVGRGGFRSADLNGVGWASALGPGAVVGAVAGRRRGSGALVPAVVVGAGCSWLVALAVDRVTWARTPYGVSHCDLTADEARGRVDELGRRGIDARLVDSVHPEDGTPSWAIESSRRHERAILDAIDRVLAS